MKQLYSIVIIFIASLYSISESWAQGDLSEANSRSYSIIESIEVYPNPASDYIFIKVSDPELEQISVEMFNIIGNKVSIDLEELQSGQYRVPLTKFNTGYYLLMVYDDQRNTNKAFKFMKR